MKIEGGDGFHGGESASRVAGAVADHPDYIYTDVMGALSELFQYFG
jgi:hypothetical protein